MSKILKNNTVDDVPLHGYVVPGSGQLTIDPGNYSLFSRSDATIEKLADGTLTMNNGSVDLTLAAGIQFLQGGFNNVAVNEQPAFAAKKVEGKSLFTRVWGIKHPITGHATDPTELDFAIPYAQVKFNALEVIGGETGDQVNLSVLDTANGDYTTIPNYQLNQFGYTAAIAPGFYKRASNYDADLYLGMRIAIDYFSTTSKDIYVNYILHELK